MPREKLDRKEIKSRITTDLQEKMVFLGGPRQVGKTTLAKELLLETGSTSNAYLNWDIAQHRAVLMDETLPANEPLLVLDEIHKFRFWRRMVKGFYDQYGSDQPLLVTGSARLDHYRKGGDSLIGRYHYHRLHPFSLREMTTSPKPSDLQMLLTYGGFPEPLSKANERHWRRWQRERVSRVVNDDLRDLETVRDISSVELLAHSLQRKVGSPLSVKSLREDLQVAHETVERWLQILENLYYCFRLPPYGAPKIRAVKKEQKLYLWDWSQIESPGPKLENLVASQLLKYCHYREDDNGDTMELRYIRDTDGREVDFVVIANKKPLFAVEVKTNDTADTKAISYFKERTDIPAFYQVHTGNKDQIKNGIRIIPFTTFCAELNLP